MYALLVLSYLIYWPGLWGLFILDDHANLESLEYIQHASLAEFGQYILSGLSSRLGRPVSLASFAVQFYGWPHTPYIFKHTNLMIHLLNGVLVFWLTLKLLDLSRIRFPSVLTIALITSSLWLLHPLQVSTVSYVIQRMTQLSALFSFITIITYLYGRQWSITGRTKQGLAMMSGAIFIGLPLAILSKESGILIPIFIGVIEWTLLADIERPRWWRIWALIFLALPIILLLGYFFIHAESLFISGYNGRNFNLVQRLLTECRILLDYLRLIFFPLPSALGLYFDDYTISTNLLSPITTLFSLLGLCLLITAAVIYRRHHPLFSFAVFWFLGGHLLESTALPLELFFLHRNYLPLLGPILAASYYFLLALSRMNNNMLRWIGRSTAAALLISFTLITYTESTVWGHTLDQAKIWAKENPDSKRSQDWYASTLIMQKKTTEARNVFLEKIRRYPQDSTPYLQMAELTCFDPSLIFRDIPKTLKLLRNAHRYDTTTLNLMIMLVRHKEAGRCQKLESIILLEMIDALSENPDYQGFRSKLHMLRGRIHNIEGIYWKALSEYERSYEIKPSLPTLLDMLKIAAEAGRVDLVEYFVTRAKEDPKLPAIQRTAYMDIIIDYESQLKRILNQN
ncbi:MAG: hypothetical protein ABFS45_01455 [Pseudomonadota bacterium]